MGSLERFCVVVAALPASPYLGCGGAAERSAGPLAPGAGGADSSAGGGEGGGLLGLGGYIDGSAFLSDSNVGRPPPPIEGADPGDGLAPTTFVARRAFYGDTDLDGNPATDAWTNLGFNLDGYTSTPAQAGHCVARSAEWTADTRTDGVGGIDNSFGGVLLRRGLLPIENASQSATGAIEDGRWSLAIIVDDLGERDTYGALRTRLAVVQRTTPPNFSDDEVWDVRASADGGAVIFEESYLTNDVLVAKTKANVLLPIPALYGKEVRITFAGLWLAARLDRAHRTVALAMLGGVADVAGLRAEASRVYQPEGRCTAAVEAALAHMLDGADSLLAGGQDSTKRCDGLSLGLAFRASVAGTLGAELPARILPADPCGGR